MDKLKLNTLQMTRLAEWLDVRIVFNKTEETYFLPSAEFGRTKFTDYLQEGNTILPIIEKANEKGISIIAYSSGVVKITSLTNDIKVMEQNASFVQAFYDALLSFIARNKF